MPQKKLLSCLRQLAQQMPGIQGNSIASTASMDINFSADICAKCTLRLMAVNIPNGSDQLQRQKLNHPELHSIRKYGTRAAGLGRKSASSSQLRICISVQSQCSCKRRDGQALRFPVRASRGRSARLRICILYGTGSRWEDQADSVCRP